MSSKQSSIAYVLTRYQYNILLAALKKLDIDKGSVAVIIAKKAYHQGVTGEGFYKSVFYDDKNEGIKQWTGLKDKINLLIDEIGLYPQNIFLRNFNATISRVLMSRFQKATLYLLEEGMPSYMAVNYLGCPPDIRGKAKTLLTRFLFSRGWLKILPVNRKQTVKVGLFETMKPWLDVPYMPVKLSRNDFNIQRELPEENKYIVDILIIDQPLWQIGMSSEESHKIYGDVFRYWIKKDIDEKKIGIKLHPSSDKREMEELLADLGYEKSVRIFDGKENIEELLFSGRLRSVKIFAGFFSWALCLIQMHRVNEDVRVIAFSNQILDRKIREAYQIMKSMGIVIKKAENI